MKTIVGYGRLPYLNYHLNLSEQDYQNIDWALETTNLKEFENKSLKELYDHDLEIIKYDNQKIVLNYQ